MTSVIETPTETSVPTYIATPVDTIWDHPRSGEVINTFLGDPYMIAWDVPEGPSAAFETVLLHLHRFSQPGKVQEELGRTESGGWMKNEGRYSWAYSDSDLQAGDDYFFAIYINTTGAPLPISPSSRDPLKAFRMEPSPRFSIDFPDESETDWDTDPIDWSGALSNETRIIPFNPRGSSKSGLSPVVTGAVVGAVVGGVLLLAIIVGAAIYFCARYRGYRLKLRGRPRFEKAELADTSGASLERGTRESGRFELEGKVQAVELDGAGLSEMSGDILVELSGKGMPEMVEVDRKSLHALCACGFLKPDVVRFPLRVTGLKLAAVGRMSRWQPACLREFVGQPHSIATWI
ncbi:hypothetical protein BJ508DRAFT_346346 [Ascobolus immersus RN42]|uniref:Uncharacterized protein n=1 Tax=Ascobolus immersus RN42 TaxID=1160509 RepID=A0A3N4I488_ASCIM|nr:hypothetical protein BJ508DRAFT_346346 [Ascobolus immersus RN42]